MKKTVVLWLVAFIITLLLAAYQRITGPTYPAKGKVEFAGREIEYNFDRNHSGEGDHKITIDVSDINVAGVLYWKRYKTNDDWRVVKMKNDNGVLSGVLPHQPPAGKLVYKVELSYGNEVVTVPQFKPVVIRFKGSVPLYLLIPHIFCMFTAMLLSTRTGLEVFSEKPCYKKFTLWTIAILFLGGIILGPVAQYYAFGEFWTGIPFGIDLTDNKTLIAFAGWLIATYGVFYRTNPKKWVIFASILLIAAYLIPHSTLGSELNYNKLDKQKNKIENQKELQK